MSTLYNLEPNPTGKVLLQTTFGDIELELFAKQTPLASRSFLQHCLDGYYNNTIFHRVVPTFIIQGGDPTGTGHGGASAIDGQPFQDEFNSRLKFNRRGLLGMANNAPNDNGSQFFITLGPTPELTGKNTLFGRVVGDTIYNVVKMGDAELAEGTERPLYPAKVTGAEILVNPFEDMVKRDVMRATAPAEKKVVKKAKRKAGKNLLSFGDDAEETGPVIKKAKYNTKFLADADVTLPEKTSKPKEKKMSKPKREPTPEPAKERSPSPKAQKKSRRLPSLPSEEERSPPPLKRDTELEKNQAEIAALKASLRRDGPEKKSQKEKPKSALEAMIPETSTRGRKRGAAPVDESSILAMFNAFKNKLDDVDDEDAPMAQEDVEGNGKARAITKTTDSGEDDDEAELCDLHFVADCQSCTDWTAQEEDDDTGDGWLGHKLSFAKDRLGKDLEWKRKNEEELMVVDPREKAAQLGIKKGYDQGRGNQEWDRKRDSGKSKA
ncbi:cyclophilin-like protein [Microthyrium microscopicum]|uniref:Cyclophilin-like protein n=1 Tax=Microthyrium microscopicum TaxID=703497 RepID=A0A6A6UD72_9PEZI|nr:cyclophilin-like protein [Microthyrium microscopicum]